MGNQICLGAFKEGMAERLKRPLPYGRYKLMEGRYRLNECFAELRRIREYVLGRGDRWRLVHCTSYDKYLWLKSLPSFVAFNLGYDLLPGLLALKEDGAEQSVINSIHPAIEISCRNLIDESDCVLHILSKSIQHEYSAMRSNGSLLEPLLLRAINLYDEALSALPDLGT